MPNIATTIIDKFIGALSPDAGLRRLRARDMLARAYEGASTKDGWRPKRAGASANTDHLADGSNLRARARSLVQTPRAHSAPMPKKLTTSGPPGAA